MGCGLLLGIASGFFSIIAAIKVFQGDMDAFVPALGMAIWSFVLIHIAIVGTRR